MIPQHTELSIRDPYAQEKPDQANFHLIRLFVVQMKKAVERIGLKI